MTTRNYVWNIVVVDCAKKNSNNSCLHWCEWIVLDDKHGIEEKKVKITSKHRNSKEKIIKKCHKTENGSRICVLRFGIHMDISINEHKPNENSKDHLFCCTLNKYVVWSSKFICLFENVERKKIDF